MKNIILLTTIILTTLALQACGDLTWEGYSTTEEEVCADPVLTKTCDLYQFVVEYSPESDGSEYCPDDYFLTRATKEPSDAGENLTGGACKKCEITDTTGSVLLDGEEAVFSFGSVREYYSETADALCNDE